MNHDYQTTFTPIGAILARRVIPDLRRTGKLPLRVSCIGTASFDGCREEDRLDRNVVIGQAPSLQDAVSAASVRVARGDIRPGTDEALRFQPRFIVILDRDHGLALAGIIRAGVVLWQQPVSCDAEARRVVTDASRLRGHAFAAADRGEHMAARGFRECAALLEARLVDPLWRETAAEILRLPQAA